MSDRRSQTSAGRPVIAFFSYHDVFEDFYPHIHVTQAAFMTTWSGSGNHAFLSTLQERVADVVWIELSLAPDRSEARHDLGFVVRMASSSALHRWLWHEFYLSSRAWRWQRWSPVFAVVASYTSLASASFIRQLRRTRPDAFFVQDYATGKFDVLVVLAKVLRVPVVAYHSGSRADRHAGSRLRRWTLRRTDALLTSSAVEARMLSERFGVPRSHCHVVLTPIDLHRFHPQSTASSAERLGLVDGRRFILFVGRLDDATKRVSVLIKVLHRFIDRYADVDLLIVGDGQDAGALRDAASRLLPGRHRFMGWLGGPDDLRAAYNAAECLVLPSRREGFPTVVGEALACGLPVVASDVGGVAEVVINRRTGWLVAPDDEDGLLAALDEVIQLDVETREGMREAARRMAEDRLAPDVVAGALLDVFAIGANRRSLRRRHHRRG